MAMTIDWNKAAVALKHDVVEHGGFLTMQKEALKKRFGIGFLKVNNSEELRRTLEEHDMIVIPHPHEAGTSLRVYDVEREIGKIALAVADPQSVPESALLDVVELYAREGREGSAIPRCAMAVGTRRVSTARHRKTARGLGGSR